MQVSLYLNLQYDAEEDGVWSRYILECAVTISAGTGPRDRYGDGALENVTESSEINLSLFRNKQGFQSQTSIHCSLQIYLVYFKVVRHIRNLSYDTTCVFWSEKKNKHTIQNVIY